MMADNHLYIHRWHAFAVEVSHSYTLTIKNSHIHITARNPIDLIRHRRKKTTFGSHCLRSIAPQVWNKLQTSFKSEQSLKFSTGLVKKSGAMASMCSICSWSPPLQKSSVAHVNLDHLNQARFRLKSIINNLTNTEWGRQREITSLRSTPLRKPEIPTSGFSLARNGICHTIN